jgi:hypothetical protein
MPGPMFRKTSCIDKYNRYFVLGIIVSTVLMALTNSILMESFWHFPIGWLIGDFIGLVLGHCCWCLHQFIPHIFPRPNKNNILDIYQRPSSGQGYRIALMPCPVLSGRANFFFFALVNFVLIPNV